MRISFFFFYKYINISFLLLPKYNYLILYLPKYSQKMNNVGINIRKLREKKGFSQEYVAQELGINQSTYGKLERENTKINIDRLLRISEILEEDVINLLDSKPQNTFHQTNQGNGYSYVENINNENAELLKELKEVYEKLIKSKDEQIELLKSLITK